MKASNGGLLRYRSDRGKLFRRIFIVVTLTSFLLWLMGIFLSGQASKQFQIFWGECGDFLADTLNVVGYSSQRDVYRNTMYTGLAEKAYPPLSYMFFYFFSRLVNMQPYYEQNRFLGMYTEPRFLTILIIVMIIQMISVYELFRTASAGSDLEKRLLAGSLIVSAPMLFSIERGNTIIATVFFLGFFIFFNGSKSMVCRELALIALAAAAAFKITPAVFGILLVYRRSWKEVLRIVIYGILLFFLPFLFFRGGLSNVSLMIQNVKIHLTAYSSADGCTLFAALLNYFPNVPAIMETVMTWCTRVMCLVLLISAPFFGKNWERVLAVSLVLIILPSHSGYYNILYLFPAVILFLNEREHDISSWFILFCFMIICFDMVWIGQKILNYHLAVVVLVAILLVKSLVSWIERLNHRAS